MKGDFTRNTFDASKHYHQVLQQQGRVQLDSDWNEQAAIAERRDETAMLDLAGHCGGPADTAGFGLGTGPTAGDFTLSPGRYYVNGIQCEVGAGVTYLTQPDRRGVPALTEAGQHLVFLDVWQRHVTALDDEDLREPALGGPDTASRLKTVWQVRTARITSPDVASPCRGTAADLESLLRSPTPVLAARALPPAGDVDPCEVPLSAGYRGLENQLYRVEIHDGGGGVVPLTAGLGTPVPSLAQNRIALAEAATVLGGAPQVGQRIELFSVVTAGGSTTVDRREVAWIAKVDASHVYLSHAPRLSGTVRARPVRATWKWSRDNGAIVFRIQGPSSDATVIDPAHRNRVKLVAPAPDDVRSLHAGDWVEALNDELELEGRPGQLLQVIDPDDGGVVVLAADLSATVFPGDRLGSNPKLRRWDGAGPVVEAPAGAESAGADPAVEAAWLAVEQGIQVMFRNGAQVRTGDYWQIPARTASPDALAGRIQWPSAPGNAPVFLAPQGIWHQYCRLGVVSVAGTVIPEHDCRCLWPAMTTIPRLFYVSGDGQEVMPYNPADPAATHFKLKWPLTVGVANPHCLDRAVEVEFTVLGPSTGRVVASGGLFSAAAAAARAPIGADGTAQCDFYLDAVRRVQQVEARLLDAAGDPVSLPIRFNANLSVASEVAYDPGDCEKLKEQHTVQDALDHLAQQVSLYPVTPLHTRLPAGVDTVTLEVQVASRCGLRDGVPVLWKVAPDASGAVTDGSVSPDQTMSGETGDPGRTGTQFQLAPQADRAVVIASIEDAAEVAEPRSVAFVIERPAQALDPGIRIVDVRFQDGTALPNDFTVSLDSFVRGIEVELDRQVSQLIEDRSVEMAHPIFTVTLDIPLRQKLGVNGGGTVLIGYHPLILAAKVRRDVLSLIWEPGEGDALRFWLEQVLKEQPKTGIRARLELRGRFVWDEKNPGINLDGEAFGWPEPPRIGIDLRRGSGDGRRGGDFEMWFWLRPEARPVLSFRPGWSLIAYPAFVGQNQVVEIFREVALPDGVQLLKFRNQSWTDRTAFELGEWSDPGTTLSPGEGAAFFNPSTQPVLIPLGEFDETGPPDLVPGWNLVGNRLLQPADFLSLTGRDPLPGTIVYRMLGPADGLPTPGGSGFTAFQFDADLGGWLPSPPRVRVGEAVFVQWPRRDGGVRSLAAPKKKSRRAK